MKIAKNIIKYLVVTGLLISATIIGQSWYQTQVFLGNNFVSYPGKLKPQSTEVYLVGTKHITSLNFNSDSLYKSLESIQPDIILIEADSSYFTHNGIKLPYRMVLPAYPPFNRYKNLEFMAATKYSQHHDDIILAPFEWEGRKELYKKIRGKSRSKMMRALYDNQTDSAHFVIARIVRAEKFLKKQKTITSFNNRRTDQISERAAFLEYEIIPSLILQDELLSKFHENARRFRDYWPTRNSYMAGNILKVVEANPGKRIVVLTGFRHRYPLRSLLSEQASKKEFKLLDLHGADLIYPGHKIL